MIKDIAFVGYPVSDMKKAREFYEGILGLVPSPEFGGAENQSWIEYNIGSGTLSLGCMAEWKPSKDGPSVAFETDDFDGIIKKLEENKIEFFIKAQHFPNCSMAVVRDFDGNMVTIHHKKN